MQYIILVIIILIIIFVKYKKTSFESSENKTKKSKEIDFNNYVKSETILSDAEINFYNVLNLSLDNNEYIICPKVRIADFVKVKGREDWKIRFNKISSKHVDFLICNKKLNPIMAIELDDKSHDKQFERDSFVNKLYESIKLPTLRIKNGQNYSVVELRDKIKELI